MIDTRHDRQAGPVVAQGRGATGCIGLRASLHPRVFTAGHSAYPLRTGLSKKCFGHNSIPLAPESKLSAEFQVLSV